MRPAVGQSLAGSYLLITHDCRKEAAADPDSARSVHNMFVSRWSRHRIETDGQHVRGWKNPWHTRMSQQTFKHLCIFYFKLLSRLCT